MYWKEKKIPKNRYRVIMRGMKRKLPETVIVYLKKNGSYLLLFRNKKENDYVKNKKY